VDFGRSWTTVLLAKLWLWHCWLGWRKGIRPVKSWVLVRSLWWFDWSFARLVDPVVNTTSVILSSTEIQNGNILVLAKRGLSVKMAVKMDRETDAGFQLSPTLPLLSLAAAEFEWFDILILAHPGCCGNWMWNKR